MLEFIERCKRMSEEWRPVIGYEGFYEVSNLGRVRGLERRIERNRVWPARILSPIMVNTGRIHVSLCKLGRQRAMQVSRMVAVAFLAAPDASKPHVAHLDGNPVNNRADNLAWVSPAENESHKKLHGTAMIGSRNHQAKYSEAQVAEMRRRYAAGQRARQIAEQMGLRYDQVRGIVGVNSKRWRHMPAPVATSRGADGQNQNDQA